MQHDGVACVCDDQVHYEQRTQGHQRPAVQDQTQLGSPEVPYTAYKLFCMHKRAMSGNHAIVS